MVVYHFGSSFRIFFLEAGLAWEWATHSDCVRRRLTVQRELKSSLAHCSALDQITAKYKSFTPNPIIIIISFCINSVATIFRELLSNGTIVDLLRRRRRGHVECEREGLSINLQVYGSDILSNPCLSQKVNWIAILHLYVATWKVSLQPKAYMAQNRSRKRKTNQPD